ncbi:hypothetical protein EDB86DRAFT_3070187 [Lactarius hatsudake]|nr:hypothetical protein EDB86DRAFT_3070187 [Lactarius hatsudake]
MAPADSVPATVRYYHYQCLPPPSNPTEFTVALRRSLRGANEAGLWGKLRGAGWLKFDKYMHFETPLRPDFPVAPPGTPRVPTLLPDVFITLVTSPSWELSPPPPQEEGFLGIPTRTSRGRSVDISPSRPLPTPPGDPPAYTVLEAECLRPLFYADSVVASADESLNHDSTVRPHQRSLLDIVGDTVSVTASSDSASEPRDSPITLSDAMVERIKEAAADTEFLDELGLSAEDYRQLLEGVDFVQLGR